MMLGTISVIEFFSVVLGIVVIVITFLKWLISRYVFYKDAKKLDQYFSVSEVKHYTRYYIPAFGQEKAPSHELELKDCIPFAVKENLIDFFVTRAFTNNKYDFKYYVVLADSGMGKTALLINIYLKYQKKFFREYDVKLVPLPSNDCDETIKSVPLEQKKKTILLLDAFDEDPKARNDYKARLKEILDISYGFRVVIMTCRTQFFPSEVEEPTDTGIAIFGPEKGTYRFQKFYLSPFDEADIDMYIKGRINIFNNGMNFLFKRNAARRIIAKSSNLLVRPMLLSYLEDILEGNLESFWTNVFHLMIKGDNSGLLRDGKYRYSFEIYEILIKKWIAREANFRPVNDRGIYIEHLELFSKNLALEIYKQFTNGLGLKVSSEIIEEIAAKHQIKIENMDLKSRSLLNRDASLLYKFSHKSILEYFLAIELMVNYRFGNDFKYKEMDQAKMFFNEMILANNLIPLIEKERVLNSFKTIESINKNDTSSFIVNEASIISEINNANKQLDRGHYSFKIKLVNGAKYDITRLNNLECDILLSNYVQEIDASHLSLKNTRQLEIFDRVTKIDFSHNRITKIDRLCLFELKLLDLSYNPIFHISNLTMPKLEAINLSYTSITSVDFLLPIKSLKHIHLIGNKLDKYHIVTLQRAIPNASIYISSDETSDDTPYYEIFLNKEIHGNYPRFRA